VAYENPAHPSAADVTTLIHDPLRDEVVLKLAGAVALPPGTVVELPGGHVARVASLRLVTDGTTQAQLIVQIVRSHQMTQDVT
jgi:hypothetical protein